MIFNMVGGVAGSAAFEFEVVNGTTQPTAPAENTIWINTGVSIAAWAFQAEQPTGAEGLLWIQTAAASVVAFDAVEADNAIMIYPTGAKLYTGGAWAAVEAFIYQAGAWVQFASPFGIDSLSITGTEGVDYIKIDDGDGNWRVKILTSQTVTVSDPGEIDVFVVGAGQGGVNGGTNGGAGGGGGYTVTQLGVAVEPGTYDIVIGAGSAPSSSTSAAASAGGSSSAFGVTAYGGNGDSASASTTGIKGGAGGSGGGGAGYNTTSGGKGGEDGSDGADSGNPDRSDLVGGPGQGTTTREFGEADGDLYAGGGGGGARSTNGSAGAGGAGGGGDGGSDTAGKSGTANTGGGGGGGVNGAGTGGSGIVIIRNKRG